jgi:DNA-binding CsgD family transcriptional regulator
LIHAPSEEIPSARLLVVGWTDDEWRVTQVSDHIVDVVGHEACYFVGASLLAQVHPTDVPDLLASASHAQAANVGISTHVRIRLADGGWLPLPVILFPGSEIVGGFGFILGPDPEWDIPAEAKRAQELERRMWRVALEIKAAGLLRDAGEVAASFDGLLNGAGFTSRQWEILNLLRRGTRAPAIARVLHLSQSTVRNHLSAIFRKLGVHSQDELLAVLRGEGAVSR